jgi:3-oxoacyl-[acyl-carrier protein] reductase
MTGVKPSHPRVLLTGATGGIGRGLAVAFAEDGARLALLGRTQERLTSLADDLAPAEVVHRAVDIRNRRPLRLAVQELAAELGGFDVVINNAGTARWVRIDTPMEEAAQSWDDVLATNLTGTFVTTLAAVPHLARPGGRIVNISSVTAFLGGHGGSLAYATSKAAVNGLTYALVRELSPLGITVNAVAPGFIETDFNADFPPDSRAAVRNETPLDRFGTVDDVVAAVRYLASPAASFVTGEILHVNGGRVFGR